MKLILLGTGTSTGIPEVGCACALCRSKDPRDKRLRTSALLITDDGKRVLIDCGPDFRQQANRIELDGIDAILLTHEHYDHVYGLDDLRTIAWQKDIPVYGQAEVLRAVRNRMHYVFSEHPYPGTPRLRLVELEAEKDILLDNIRITPFIVMHGVLPIYGYSFTKSDGEHQQKIVYITDMKSIDTRNLYHVQRADLLVINALRYQKEHPSHQSISDVERFVSNLEVRPPLTVLTHLSHHAPSHESMQELLSDDIIPGYDFMCLGFQGKAVNISSFKLSHPVYQYKSVSSDTITDEYNSYLESLIREREINNILMMAFDEQNSTLIAYLGLSLDMFSVNSRDLSADMVHTLRQFIDTQWIRDYTPQLSCDVIGLCPVPMWETIHFTLQFDESRSPLDVTVAKHLLSAYIYKYLKTYTKERLQSSICS